MAEPNKGRILIVDDEDVVRESLHQWFDSEGYHTRAAASGKDALTTVGEQQFDLALLDIRMPGMDGIELQQRLVEADPDLTVVIMTGYGTVETAVQALKHGAYDYVTKPIDPDDLSRLVAKAIQHRRTTREVVRLRENLLEIFPTKEAVGRSPAMKKVMDMAETVAPTDATVLITGESGTGKEVIARAIHAASPRRHNPMVTIHCGALTETLLESELFGHERGAFTGAQFRKKGKFEAADGGTIFLDEISDISLRTQTDLLRVLQEKEIVRVGGTQQIKVDFRCIAATNRDLQTLVKAGTFRPDLFYRLHVVAINMPPLRDRREDVPLLAAHFCQKFAAAMGRPEAPRIPPETMDRLISYDWPGNVRELENAVERAMVINRGPLLRSTDFLLQTSSADGSENGCACGQKLDDVERAHIERVLKECGGNHSRAARILDIDRTTLYSRLRRYGLK